MALSRVQRRKEMNKDVQNSSENFFSNKNLEFFEKKFDAIENSFYKKEEPKVETKKPEVEKTVNLTNEYDDNNDSAYINLGNTTNYKINYPIFNEDLYIDANKVDLNAKNDNNKQSLKEEKEEDTVFDFDFSVFGIKNKYENPTLKEFNNAVKKDAVDKHEESATEQKTEEVIVEKEEVKPVVEQKTEEVVVEKEETKPVVEQKVEEPKQEDVKPIVEQEIVKEETKPVIEETAVKEEVKPVVEESAKEEKTIEEPIVEEKVVEETVVENKDNLNSFFDTFSFKISQATKKLNDNEALNNKAEEVKPVIEETPVVEEKIVEESIIEEKVEESASFKEVEKPITHEEKISESEVQVNVEPVVHEEPKEVEVPEKVEPAVQEEVKETKVEEKIEPVVNKEIKPETEKVLPDDTTTFNNFISSHEQDSSSVLNELNNEFDNAAYFKSEIDEILNNLNKFKNQENETSSYEDEVINANKDSIDASIQEQLDRMIRIFNSDDNSTESQNVDSKENDNVNNLDNETISKDNIDSINLVNSIFGYENKPSVYEENDEEVVDESIVETPVVEETPAVEETPVVEEKVEETLTPEETIEETIEEEPIDEEVTSEEVASEEPVVETSIEETVVDEIPAVEEETTVIEEETSIEPVVEEKVEEKVEETSTPEETIEEIVEEEPVVEEATTEEPVVEPSNEETVVDEIPVVEEETIEKEEDFVEEFPSLDEVISTYDTPVQEKVEEVSPVNEVVEENKPVEPEEVKVEVNENLLTSEQVEDNLSKLNELLNSNKTNLSDLNFNDISDAVIEKEEVKVEEPVVVEPKQEESVQETSKVAEQESKEKTIELLPNDIFSDNKKDTNGVDKPTDELSFEEKLTKIVSDRILSKENIEAVLSNLNVVDEDINLNTSNTKEFEKSLADKFEETKTQDINYSNTVNNQIDKLLLDESYSQAINVDNKIIKDITKKNASIAEDVAIPVVNGNKDSDFERTISIEVDKLKDEILNNTVQDLKLDLINNTLTIKPVEDNEKTKVLDVEELKPSDKTSTRTVSFLMSDEDDIDESSNDTYNKLLNVLLVVFIFILVAIIAVAAYLGLQLLGVI